MIEEIRDFIKEERGQISLPFNLVVGLVVAIAVLAVLLGFLGPMGTVNLAGEITYPTKDLTEDTKRVDVTITNTKNGQPVEGVLIEIEGCSVGTAEVTEDNGQVQLTISKGFKIPTGTGYCIVSVKATKEGWFPRYFEWAKQEVVKP